MRVELQIDKLVLDGVGVSPRQANGVRAEVTRELTALFSVPAAGWQRNRKLRHVRAQPMRDGSLPRGVANAIHQAVQGVR